MLNPEELYEQILFLSLGQTVKIRQARLIAAGNINQGIYLETSEGLFFLKTNFEEFSDIFEKEADGLKKLKANTTLQVPEVIHYGKITDQHFLLMEWIPTDRQSKSYWKELGVGLAHLHMSTQAHFGYVHDNYIASLIQQNNETALWSDFFINSRLEPLIGKAYYEGLVDHAFFKKFQKAYPLIQAFFPKEKPALIHGDLWSGNVLKGTHGNPALIDPAVYYGHREMDLAFSKLFGGFEMEFYDAYETVFPLEPGFGERVPVYNLYPLLVHLLLFGPSYLPGIEKTISKLTD